ncbi:pentatricopeptide repeat-containing protein At5g16420, mitochondrial-like [Euphorbia lathyris]|uniref:pentatricopeptide repeat-containing protein At5g16420, mitochondrial-like n=1 Tax=Euphorbia lathyris TaxID=212925 RepID=UPI0033140856
MLRSAQSHLRPKIMPAQLLSLATVASLPAATPKTSHRDSCTIPPPITPWPKPLNPKHLASMINSEQNLDLALQIFDYAGKYDPDFSHNYDTYDSIIHKLSRARSFYHMEVFLSDLQKAQIKCSEKLFITVIGNYGLSGETDLALKTFIRMKDFNVPYSVRSLNTLLNAFVQNKKYDLVTTMFENCRNVYGVVPDVFTCNISIKAFCEKNDIEGALKVFDKMPSMRVIPYVVSYTTMLGGYVSSGDMVKAKKVIGGLLNRGWLPDARTYTILINGYCQQGRLAEAIELMNDMEVEPNDATYGVIIEAFCKEKRAGEALNLFDEIIQRDYTPNPGLCRKVIDVLCEEGKVEEACELWKRVFEKIHTPGNAMYSSPGNVIISTLINWLCKEGKLGEAKKLFDEFEQSATPSLITYNALIAGMCEKGELSEVRRLRDVMAKRGSKPNAFTYNMLIKGFSKVGNTKEGVRILKEMLEQGCMPNKSTYGMLIEELFKMKRVEFNKVMFIAMTNGGIDGDSWELFLNKVVTKPDRGMVCLDGLLMQNASKGFHEHKKSMTKDTCSVSINI